jgi:hypothetical protein
MKYLVNIIRRLLGRKPQPISPPAYRQTTAEQPLDSVYFVKTRKGIVVLY